MCHSLVIFKIIGRWLKAQAWDGVYACGPQPMLDDLTQRTAAWPTGRFRQEKFKAEAIDTALDQAFELVLARSSLRTSGRRPPFFLP